MPDYFSHGVCAEIIYEKLESKYRSKITSKTLYLLGAQGGDVFFAYNVKPTKTNLGRTMHAMNAVDLFEKLIRGNPSFAAGFATHYALDCTLHPEIYAYERTKRSPLSHIKFENDLGLFISRKYGLRRQIIPREKVLACTYAVYDTAKFIEPSITVTGVERCLKRHFTYTRFLYRRKKQNYKCAYDFKKLSDSVDDAVDLGVLAVKCVLDGRIDPDVFGRSFLQK
ncbi:MAG: zinc dependent phospholipase C family protein [Clostridia bacterium]|nr:zinc dependent phospholipase C family protein [Clostridia bacterium]